jgi:hypothetical protein
MVNWFGCEENRFQASGSKGFKVRKLHSSWHLMKEIKTASRAHRLVYAFVVRIQVINSFFGVKFLKFMDNQLIY